MRTLDVVDGAAEGRVLVFGSLPPEGRDLDLLVRPAEESAIAASLSAADFLNRDAQWVRFRGCEVDVVELVPAASWALPQEEIAALFDQAKPLEGATHLAEPSAHHALLILARKISSGSELTEKRRLRLERFLSADPSAWQAAEQRAGAWNAGEAVTELRAEHEGRGRRWPRVSLPKRRPRVLIALSGMDGSGKSTLAQRLSTMLYTLGMPTEIVWNRLAVNPSLDIVAVPVKRFLGILLRRRVATSTGTEDGEPRDPGTELRAKSPMLTQIWTCFVAVWNAVSHRRSAEPHLLRGKVVVCDRYVLDSVVNLRFDYGTRFRFRFQRRLVEWISPTPTLAFHLAVPAGLAHERKPVRFTLEELEVFERLYEEERDPSIVRVDGSRSTQELCEEIARTIWSALVR